MAAVAPVGRVYIQHQRQLREQVAATLARIYDAEIDGDDIEGSFEAVSRRAAPVVVAGQRQAALLVQGLVRAQTGAEAVRPGDLTAALTAARDGMSALPSMVLGQVGLGVALPDALAYGSYLVGRFGTSEVIKAADTEQARLGEQVPAIIGWTGVVAADACDNCQANQGDHGLDEEMWRHGNCGCERLPLYGSA